MPIQPKRNLFLAVACAVVHSAGAGEPSELDEVVVTATLRPLPARELPAGVSVLAGRDISDAAVVHLEELLPQLPSLSWAGASSRPRYFQLRGIGELEQYQGAPNPSVGFLVDEIDFSGIGMVASMFDVEQVEVLRGPQGTRYGANALGGLIKLKTRDPAEVRELGVEAGFGDDGLWTAGMVAGGALPPAAAASGAWRAVFQRAASDGFRRNAFSGREDTNGRDETSARLKFRVADGAGWRGDLALLYADFDNRYDAFAIDNSLVTLSDRPGRDAQRSRAASLDLAFDGWDNLAWRSVSTWAESDIEASFDADWGNAASWGAAGPYDFFSRTLRTRRNLSQDFRLESGTGSWIAGFWASRLEETNRIADEGLYLQDAFLRILDSRYRATGAALYGQAEWQSGPATSLSAGLRLEERSAKYDDSDGLGVDPRDRLWGGELSLAHAIGERHRFWATLARGYRAGGFNIGTSVPADRQAFDPEYLWTVELG